MAVRDELLLELYRRMLVIRITEEKHEKMLAEGTIQLMGHFGTGQEAVAIGVTGPLTREDILFGTHRGVGEYVGKGMKAEDIWAEYLGKRTGLSKGKGTLHLTDRELNIPFVVSSLGSDFSIAVGSALASKMLKKDRVTMYFVGEGTCNQGDFHPSLCMAALWKLPVVFAVANNQFCELSHMCDHYPTEDVAPRAAGYGIPYEIVDGQDVETAYEATARAVDHARSGKGPFLVEYKTFRIALHYSGDPGGYVRPEDLEAWKQRDPIRLCQEKLIERRLLSPERDGELRREIAAEVDAAVEAALAAPYPTAEDFVTDVCREERVL